VGESGAAGSDPAGSDPASTDPASFYRQVDEFQFESTTATMSPWEAHLQHGGPPSALLARAIEHEHAAGELVVGRISIDFFGGIPQGLMTTAARVVRPGRRIELVEASLTVAGRLVAVARAWLLKPSPDVTAAEPVAPPDPVPAPQPQRYLHTADPDWGYGRAIDWRFVEGGFTELGPARVWTRVKVPLVEGESSSGLQRMLVVADSVNGLSAVLDPADWLFVPPGLTVHARRVDAGEWLFIDATTVIDSSGVGLAQATMSDGRGQLGSVTQPLMVQRR
jgi:hypothetical protein